MQEEKKVRPRRKRKIESTEDKPKRKAEPKTRLKQKISRKSSLSSSGVEDKPSEKVSQPIQEKLKSLVDKHMTQAGQYHVYDDGTKIYHASLMWTDLLNNNNKFYIIQLLQSNSDVEMFFVFNRWGRVGADGQAVCFPFSDIGAAINCYFEKYNEKTEKGYTEIKMAHEDESEDDSKMETLKKVKYDIATYSNSKLDPRIQVLLHHNQ